MATINTGSDLLEALLTPEETLLAQQFMDKNLSIMYLTNTRIGIMRQLADQEFSDPNKDGENHRVRAYLKGQYDLLGALLEGAISASPTTSSTSSIEG
jgi:hypothetical protein